MNTKIRRLTLCIGLFILTSWNLSAAGHIDTVSSGQSITKTYTFNNITTPVIATAYIQASGDGAIGTILLVGSGIGTVINITASSSGSWFAEDAVSNLMLPDGSCSFIHIGSCGADPAYVYLKSTISW